MPKPASAQLTRAGRPGARRRCGPGHFTKRLSDVRWLPGALQPQDLAGGV